MKSYNDRQQDLSQWTRDQGCVTCMLKGLDLPLLQDRRKANTLVFFYKVVEGQVPALPFQDYLTPLRNKCQIKSKKFTDFVSSNIVVNQSTNNSKCFKPIQCNSNSFWSSFFSKTLIYWNHLGDSVVLVILRIDDFSPLSLFLR